MLYQLSKLIHILGFITGVGIMLTMTLAFREFWKLYFVNPQQGLATFKSFAALQKFGMIGLLLVLVGGISMATIADWSYWNFLWFKIKLGLVVLMLVNGFTMGRTSTLQFQEFLKKGATDVEEAKRLQARLKTFQISQLGIFVLIILLSVFRIS